MNAEREPTIEEIAVEEPEPQPSAESAGGARPPGRIGSGLFDNEGWRELPIEDLHLSMRTYNCLRRSGLVTVGAILGRSVDDLMALRNFGRKSYDELREKLDELQIVGADSSWPGGDDAAMGQRFIPKSDD